MVNVLSAKFRDWWHRFKRDWIEQTEAIRLAEDEEEAWYLADPEYPYVWKISPSGEAEIIFSLAKRGAEQQLSFSLMGIDKYQRLHLCLPEWHCILLLNSTGKLLDFVIPSDNAQYGALASLHYQVADIVKDYDSFRIINVSRLCTNKFIRV